LPSVRPLRPVERNVSGAPRHHTDNLDPVSLGSALVSTGEQTALTGSRHAHRYPPLLATEKWPANGNSTGSKPVGSQPVGLKPTKRQNNLHVQISSRFEFGIQIALSDVGRMVVALKKRAVAWRASVN
jgi:hypothetical protein